MSDELRELYQEMILDHGRRPRNLRALAGASSAEGYNPLCGDRMRIYVRVDEGRIGDVSFEGTGCAISTASASMMTETLKGKSVDEAELVLGRFHDMLTSDGRDLEQVGKLAVFSGVREFPSRVKCATLAWHTLKAALRGGGERVTTE